MVGRLILLKFYIHVYYLLWFIQISLHRSWGGWVGIFAKQPLFCQKEPIINWVVLQLSDSAKAIVHYCLKDTAAYMYIIKTCLPISTQQYVLLYLHPADMFSKGTPDSDPDRFEWKPYTRTFFYIRQWTFLNPLHKGYRLWHSRIQDGY